MIDIALRLGAVEGGRMLRNPLLWGSMAPALLWAIWVETPADEHFLLSGYGLVLAWFASMAIAAFAVRRSRGGLVGHTLDPLPAGRDVRTLGVGLGTLAAAFAGLVVTLVVWAVRAPNAVLGITDDTLPRGLEIPRPTIAQLVQGPLVLLVFASIGLLLGRWVPSWLLVPALFVPIVLQFLWFGVWSSEGTPWFIWLLPMASGWVSNEWTGVCNGVGPCDLQVSGFDRITPWWHTAYLICLASLFVSIAVALDRRRDARRWVLVAAVATVALGTVQVATYERWSP